MKILVLNGSPKRDSSDTMCITRALLEGMREVAPVTGPRLELIRKAGYEYARNGEIPQSMLEEIMSPMIPDEQYAAIVNSGV